MVEVKVLQLNNSCFLDATNVWLDKIGDSGQDVIKVILHVRQNKQKKVCTIELSIEVFASVTD